MQVLNAISIQKNLPKLGGILPIHTSWIAVRAGKSILAGKGDKTPVIDVITTIITLVDLENTKYGPDSTFSNVFSAIVHRQREEWGAR